MKEMGKTYQSSTEELIESYNDTITTIQDLNNNFTAKLLKITEDTDEKNKEEVAKTERSHYEQSQDIKNKTMKMIEEAQGIYNTCKKWTSRLTFGWKDGCVGKNAPNVNIPKTFKLDMGNLEKSLDPILKYIGDEKERDTMGVCGNHTY